MTTKTLLVGAIAACFSLGACEPAAPPAEPANAPADIAAAPQTPAAPETPAAAPDTKGKASAANGDLTHYVGQYPAKGFMNDAAVKAAIAKIPADAAKFVRGPATEVPVFKAGDKVVANGCEQHNCSGHNWAVMMKADGKAGDICVFSAQKPGPGEFGLATWYLADGRTIRGNVTGCPTSAEEVETLYPAN